jgi:hypothetical protein
MRQDGRECIGLIWLRIDRDRCERGDETSASLKSGGIS